MISYPRMKEKVPLRKHVEVFKGYHRDLRVGSGEFFDMENLTSDDYPVLSVRKKRGLVEELQDSGYSTGAIYVPDVGVFFTLNHQKDYSDEEYGALYLLDTSGEILSIRSPLLPGSKSLALMGKHMILAPDMISVDMDTLVSGKIEYGLEINSGMVYYQMCHEDGAFFSNLTISEVSPENPADGAYWVEVHGEDRSLRQYSTTQQQWLSITSTYVKVWGRGLSNHSFRAGDVITITGMAASALNGDHGICSVDQDSVVIEAQFLSSGEVDCDTGATVKLVRSVPQLDFIVESGNRLWGCEKKTNEIRACKLGNFKSWQSFQGLSTDSWVGTIGTPGEFTGAVVQNGYPVFYKENCKHKVWPSANGAHQITTVNCNGVEKDSESSLAVCEGTVFYKSAFGIFADDGGGAVEIGQALGDIRYHRGNGAVHDGKYYLSLEDNMGKRKLFVYDIAGRMWHRENSAIGVLCSAGNSLYCVEGGEIWDITGSTGTPEKEVSWYAVTGDLGLELPEQKYISRLTLRLSLDPGATLEIYAQYDREQTWVKLGQVYGIDLRSFSLPVRPRRCDQLRLKLQGTGMCKIYSITETLERGSELP